MKIQHFYDTSTSTLTYLISDEANKIAVLIDPLLDYDAKSARTSTQSAEVVAAHIREHGLELKYVLDTHPHADHVTALPYFKEQFGAQTAMSANMPAVQAVWKKLFDLDNFKADGSQFDILLKDGDTLEFGALSLEAILTEGHTPASMTFKIEDALFVGDLIFMPDQGTARCDFPGGSAEVMHEAIMRLYKLPDETRVFTLHDYQPGGREMLFETTIGDEKAHNVHIQTNTSTTDFAALRKRIEDGKPAPNLLFPAVQLNIRGGQFPTARANGIAYLNIPLNWF